MKPRFPIYIPSKGRAETALTPRAFDKIGVPYYIIVEEKEYEQYAKHYNPDCLLILDPEFQRRYDPCDEYGLERPPGAGPARNFGWEHSIANGFDWHWCIDDNIRHFSRFHKNTRIIVGDGTIFHAMETFVMRYKNVGMAGPHYEWFIPSRSKHPPFIVGSRIYSCNLIRNDIPFRWRGRMNEDTILSLDILKGGYQTVLFNTFLAHKMRTQVMTGGYTSEFYAKEGTHHKSEILVRLHPDVARHMTRYGRDHHYVDYREFANIPLIKRDDYDPATEPVYNFRVKETGLGRKNEDAPIPKWLEEETQRSNT